MNREAAVERIRKLPEAARIDVINEVMPKLHPRRKNFKTELHEYALFVTQLRDLKLFPRG